jgi:hypothetical protein
MEKTINEHYKRIPAIKVRRGALLPQQNLGYEQMNEFSQHRNGSHVIYKALHTLNLATQAPVAASEIYALLKSAPNGNGRIKRMSRTTISVYLARNPYKLWRRIEDTRQSVGKDGRLSRPSYLYVARGLSVNGKRLGRRKLPVVLASNRF